MIGVATIGQSGLDVVESLGYRGTDGLPYAFKVLQSAANLAMGRKWTHRVAQGVITLNQIVQPAATLYAIFAQPFVDLPRVRKHVGIWIQDVRELVKSKIDAKKIFADTIKTAVFFFAYLYNLSKAVQEVIVLGVWTASEPVQTVLARVALVTSTIFASCALLGTGLKAAVTTYTWVKLPKDAPDEDRKFARLEMKHAVLGFLRIATKIALVAAASYFTLTTQAIVTLGVVTTEIYLKRHRNELKRANVDIVKPV